MRGTINYDKLEGVEITILVKVMDAGAKRLPNLGKHASHPSLLHDQPFHLIANIE